jgi:hypothetical protein
MKIISLNVVRISKWKIIHDIEREYIPRRRAASIFRNMLIRQYLFYKSL